MKRALVLAGLLAALAGCGGSGSSAAPGVLPPVSSTPSASPVPTAPLPATPPTIATASPMVTAPPTEAEVERTASEVARRWVDALNKAYTTLDTTELEALSAPECGTCQSYVNGMAHARSVGETWVGGLLTVTDVAPAPRDVAITEVTVAFTSEPFHVLTASGERRGDQPAETRAAMQMLVQDTSAGGLVTQVLLL